MYTAASPYLFFASQKILLSSPKIAAGYKCLQWLPINPQFYIRLDPVTFDIIWYRILPNVVNPIMDSGVPAVTVPTVT